jgi:tRNA A-37 threonylcarbamoyl transferase component Bud32
MSNVPPSPLRQIDLVADRFERQWQLGDCPRIADYLDQVPADLRLRLLAELVCIDLEHRLRKKLPVALEHYFRQFPELDGLAPADREDLERHARQRCEELGPTVDYTPPPSPTPPEAPAAIGRFPIAGRLGSGGQADVFLSFHPELRVPVVVKWRHRPVDADSAHREQMLREGQILAGLELHPNLLRVYDLGFHEGRPFLVLEHVSGQTLEEHAQLEHPGPQTSAKLVAALAGAVHAAHQQRVVHQDINPRNVLIDGRGQPRLIDFGLAWSRSPWADPDAETRPDAGTPECLSPEQADPTIGPVGPRTDVFGLGAVLYYLLTGRALYHGETLRALLRQAARADYDATALNKAPRRLAAVCRKALARDPQDRFATALEFAAALRTAIRPPRWRKVAALAGLLLAAIACGWLLEQPGRQGAAPVAEANRQALEVRVWRPETRYTPLSQAVPVRTGDWLQVRFRAPAGLHLALCSVNGQGRLSMLQQYPPLDSPTELVWPGPDQRRRLEAPAGTEILLVCGRPGAALAEKELQTAWGGAAAWPALDPPERLLRLQPGRVKEEGDRPRDWGATQHEPGSDAVAQRLEGLRQGLRPICPFFEGVAFAHQ